MEKTLHPWSPVSIDVTHKFVARVQPRPNKNLKRSKTCRYVSASNRGWERPADKENGAVKMLIIHLTLDITTREYEQLGQVVAEQIARVPGLMRKTWIWNSQTQKCGGSVAV